MYYMEREYYETGQGSKCEHYFISYWLIISTMKTAQQQLIQLQCPIYLFPFTSIRSQDGFHQRRESGQQDLKKFNEKLELGNMGKVMQGPRWRWRVGQGCGSEICQKYSLRAKNNNRIIFQSNIDNIYKFSPIALLTQGMSQHHHQPTSNNLHAIFGRSDIVQKYPPTPQYNHHLFLEEELLEPKPNDFFDSLMRQHEIVEEYADHDLGNTRRSIMNCDNLMASESDNNEVPSRNSSLSSKENNLDFHNRSFDRLPFISKKYSEEAMDIQLPVENKKPIVNYILPKTPVRLDVGARDREKTEKINKIQEVGCNCRKSKCLKMYCECFHLQIFCSQNCNCVDCGNIGPNQGHQQAVIDALTRNPKAFQQQKPTTQNAFTLGVQLAEVKKGCKCKKTKCLKKYCECYNSGSKCGIFCKCENCENNANENNNN